MSDAVFVVVTFKTTEEVVEPWSLPISLILFPRNREIEISEFQATKIFVGCGYFGTTDVPAGGDREHAE